MNVLLCSPTYFYVPGADPDNYYMDSARQPDFGRCMEQHATLWSMYAFLGLKTFSITPRRDAPDMTFTANCALTFVDRKGATIAVLSNFKPPHRKIEQRYFHEFFETHRSVIHTLRPEIVFEGAGDAICYAPPGKERVIFLGYGFRTSKSAVSYLERICECEVIPLKLRHTGGRRMKPYHLDTACTTFEEQETFILYKNALAKESLKLLEKYGRIVSASYADFASLSLNAVVIPRKEIYFSDYHGPPGKDNINVSEAHTARRMLEHYPGLRGIVITSRDASKELKKVIWEMFYCGLFLDLSEFKKSGGGAFCLTKILPELKTP